jgi:hypothetical protein
MEKWNNPFNTNTFFFVYRKGKKNINGFLGELGVMTNEVVKGNKEGYVIVLGGIKKRGKLIKFKIFGIESANKLLVQMLMLSLYSFNWCML